MQMRICCCVDARPAWCPQIIDLGLSVWSIIDLVVWDIHCAIGDIILDYLLAVCIFFAAWLRSPEISKLACIVRGLGTDYTQRETSPWHRTTPVNCQVYARVYSSRPQAHSETSDFEKPVPTSSSIFAAIACERKSSHSPGGVHVTADGVHLAPSCPS